MLKKKQSANRKFVNMKKIFLILALLIVGSGLFSQTVNIRGNKLQLRYGTEVWSVTLMGDSIYFDGNLMKFGRAFGGDSLVIGADTVYGGGFYVTDTLGVTTYRLLGIDTIAEGGGGSGVLDTGYVKTTGDLMYNNYTSFNGSWLWSGTIGATPASGAGTRMMWIPVKGAFRAGTINTTQWDDANIGTNSFSVGNNGIASGNYSTSIGIDNIASGYSSFSSGENTAASGQYSFSAGESTVASGAGSVSFGTSATSRGSYSFTMGRSIISNSYTLVVIGAWNDTTISTNLTGWTTTDPLFKIGNGLSDITRNNAFQILKNGKTFIADLDNTTDAILIVDPTDSTSAFIGDVDITGTLTIPDTVTLNAVLAAGTVTKLKIGLVDSITIDTVNALKLYGNATVWDDYVVPATRTYVNPSTSLPAFDLDSIALKFVRDADSSEVAYFSVQIPHAARYGTDVVCSPHFHYMSYAAGDTTFQVALMYRIHKVGGTSGAWTRLRYSRRALLTFTTAPFHQICEFPNIALNNVSESSIIDFKLYRYDSEGNPATMYYKSFDVHFEFDKLGSPNEYISH